MILYDLPKLGIFHTDIHTTMRMALDLDYSVLVMLYVLYIQLAKDGTGQTDIERQKIYIDTRILQ